MSLLCLLERTQAGSGADPWDQSAWREITLYRAFGDSLVRVTDSNCIGVHACPDSLDGNPRADTTGVCVTLRYVNTSMSFAPNVADIWPNSNDLRQAYSIYLLGTGGDPDTLVMSGVRLDFGAPIIGTVDSSAVAAGAIEGVHVDSTSTFYVGRLEADGMELRQAGASGIALESTSGTADATGAVIGITGGSSGKAISIPSWKGPGFYYVRAAGGSTYDGILLDMSGETGTGATVAGLAIDSGGDGMVTGIEVIRSDGTRAFADYGIRISISSGATTTDGTSYAGHFDASPTVTDSSRAVALYATTAQEHTNRALIADQDVALGNADTDSLWFHGTGEVKGSWTFADSVFFADSGYVSIGNLNATDMTVTDDGSFGGDLTVTDTLTAGTIVWTGSLAWSLMALDAQGRHAPEAPLYMDSGDTLFVDRIDSPDSTIIFYQDAQIPNVVVNDSLHVGENATVAGALTATTVESDSVNAAYGDFSDTLRAGVLVPDEIIYSFGDVTGVGTSSSLLTVADSTGPVPTLGVDLTADWPFADISADSVSVTGYLGVSGPIATSDALTVDGTVTANERIEADSLYLRAGASYFGGAQIAGEAKLYGADTRIGDADTDSLTVKAKALFVPDVTTQGKLTVGNAGTDSLSVFGDIRARGGDVVAGTAGVAGALTLSDGSSNTYAMTALASTVNWTMPIPIYADTVAVETSRTLWGDRRGSEYVAGLSAATDVVSFHIPHYDVTPGGSQQVRYSCWVVNDSLCYNWYSTWDGYTGYVIVYRIAVAGLK